nr:class I SAM-dependent methyltransferase [Lactobacillus helveticus]
MTNSSVGFPQFYQIQQILDRFLVVGGRIAIMIYYGHEGDGRKNAVIKWTSSLPQKTGK